MICCCTRLRLCSIRGEEIGNEKMTVILDLQQIAFKNVDKQMIVVAQNGKTGNMVVDSMYKKVGLDQYRRRFSSQVATAQASLTFHLPVIRHSDHAGTKSTQFTIKAA